MTNAYASTVRSIVNCSPRKPTSRQSKPRNTVGISTRLGAKITAALRRGVLEFSGNTQANTISEHCMKRAITKLAAAHQRANVSVLTKFQKTRSFVVQRARNDMKAAKV